ncbi:DUF4910 domain-containing protein [Magnetospirillum sp. SS-4]|uniref:DUF4910 domain-containing protein n=1 Tax=Magnetospirillum sp. SS-4 TaxID=2681465 RepID=UPI00137FCF92|nr:DUF4910 domain-containing protein [Magnetospirillum sp. SS-4]CAA7617798.1 conserved hypothetical protein [Magnetospirillum sp. SS-4]
MTCLPSPDEVESWLRRLWPIMRSITGEGQRQTHDMLGELLPLSHWDIPTGTPILDWEVPREWVFRQAFVEDPSGRRILDARDHTLHLVNYSHPFSGTLALADLQPHLHSLPDRPHAIPYVTSYYAPRWGFCLPDALRATLPEGRYRVTVDTDLIDGVMRVSDCVLPGDEEGEVLFSSYTCHPSMANNELSGPLVLAFLHRALAALPRRRLTYRFVLGPENIGSIAYLSRHGEHLRRHLLAGYVLTNIGDRQPLSLKLPQRGGTLAERAARTAFRDGGIPHRVLDFDPRGADERNYCSPGYDFPVAALMRGYFQESPEYHTSDDNLDHVAADSLIGAVSACLDICRVLEANRTWRNTRPFGEPFYSRHDLAPTLSRPDSSADRQLLARRWLMNQADGRRDLIAIAERSGLGVMPLAEQAAILAGAGLLVPEDDHAAAQDRPG